MCFLFHLQTNWLVNRSIGRSVGRFEPQTPLFHFKCISLEMHMGKNAEHIRNWWIRGKEELKALSPLFSGHWLNATVNKHNVRQRSFICKIVCLCLLVGVFAQLPIAFCSRHFSVRFIFLLPIMSSATNCLHQSQQMNILSVI